MCLRLRQIHHQPRHLVLYGIALFFLTALKTSARADDHAQLRAAVQKALDTEIRGLFYPATLDREHGGFHENLARDGTVLADQGYSVVYQARMTWTAAAYAEFNPERKAEFLEYARHGLKCLNTTLRDTEQGGFHWSVNRDGRLDARNGAEKHAYGTAFVVYAASKLHQVSGDATALKVAQDAFDWLERHGHDPEFGGYFEAFSRAGEPLALGTRRADGTLATDRLGIPYGYKTMNSHIHLLEAFAALVKSDPRPIVRQRLEEVLTLVRDKIATEPGALHLYLSRDWKPVPAHDSFGHDVETAYLLVEAAEAVGKPEDPATWRMAKLLLDHALEAGWDQTHGGFYDKGDSIGGSAYDTTKVWWTQAEGLNTLLLFHEKFGAQTDRYQKSFLAQWNFIQKHQIDPEFGGWFSEVSREGKLLGNGAKASPWKACYHTGRSLINIDRMLGDKHTGKLAP